MKKMVLMLSKFFPPDPTSWENTTLEDIGDESDGRVKKNARQTKN
jgi:hypothetical protein